MPCNRVLSRPDLRSCGLSARDIGRLVADGSVVRVRAGSYLRGDSDPTVLAAMRAGGRLACVSALAALGVFVHGGAAESTRGRGAVHAHVPAHGSRFRAESTGARLHWAPLVRRRNRSEVIVDIVDALVQSAACQSPRALIASLDSALHGGVLHPDDLEAVVQALPRRFRRLVGLADGRAESGTETLVRLMLRGLGKRPELQVFIRGVGRVDLVVDGWLVIECDSRAHHGSWEEIRRDRRRDQALAAAGYVVYRPIAEDILFHPEVVLDALRGLLGSAAVGGATRRLRARA